MSHTAKPIAIIDSGLGGLTVAQELRKQLPCEDLIYFGDTAHLPYGSKSAETVTAFVRRIIRFLISERPKHVVIACNTATAVAMPALITEFADLPISGVIEPGARAAVVAAGTKRVPNIGVIATEATIKSKAYDRAIMRRRHLAHVFLRATPLLVPMIEEGRTSEDPLVEMALRQYLQGMLLQKIDVLVLGCTHYPLLKPAIAKVVGPRVKLIDSAEQCAQDVARRLARRQMLRSPTASKTGEKNDSDKVESPAGSMRAFVTDDPSRFASLAGHFLQLPIDKPTLIDSHQLEKADAPSTYLRAG